MGTRVSILKAGGMLVLVACYCLLQAAPISAATPGELLQKAIYTEETVGNLDEAIKLYEQVVSEGKAADDAAAQAQYRLAVCYEKLGRDADAKAAFEKVIADYPSAKDLVAQAQKHLPSAVKLLPTPWTLGERMQFDMKLPTGLPVGTMIYMVDGAKHDGKDVTRCSTRGIVTINNAASYSWVLCETDSFQPFESFWKHSLLGEATATYANNSVEILVAGRKDPLVIDFTPPAFDNEQCVELFRRLPLEVGYKSTFTVIPILTGTTLPLGVEVPSKESITVPAGTFECYKLVLNIGQTFWISNDEHRYLVRFVAGGVTADLTKVWQAESTETESVKGADFSLTLPAGWLSYDAGKPSEPNEASFVLLDPAANATTQIAIRPKSMLKDEQQTSTKAWTESFINDIKRIYPDFQVSEAGLVETEVGGQPATQIVADFTDGDKKMRMLGVAVIGNKSAATLRFSAAVDKFDGLRKDFDAIVASFKLN